MSLIHWSQAMSVGVERLDRDHRVLISLINRLTEAETDPQSATLVHEVLDTLFAYTEFHFRREERAMEAAEYPETMAHRQEHHDLADEVRVLQERFRQDPAALGPTELHDFLTLWLNHHILLQDMAYRPYVADNPAAIAAAEAHGPFDFSPFPLAGPEKELEGAA